MSAELTIIAYLVVLVASVLMAYQVGKADSALDVTHAELKTKATERVVKVQNAEITYLRHQVAGVNGLWATDQPDLIKHHAKKERFFRIGYPEHKL